MKWTETKLGRWRLEGRFLSFLIKRDMQFETENHYSLEVTGYGGYFESFYAVTDQEAMIRATGWIFKELTKFLINIPSPEEISNGL